MIVRTITASGVMEEAADVPNFIPAIWTFGYHPRTLLDGLCPTGGRIEFEADDDDDANDNIRENE